jgi:hypothetical protein
MPFFQSIPETLLPPPGLLTKVCCALRAAYPAGDATVAILRSMPPNSRNHAGSRPATRELSERTTDKFSSENGGSSFTFQGKRAEVDRGVLEGHAGLEHTCK